jgi:murein L,D-transpeptidase YcbB/YkuD
LSIIAILLFYTGIGQPNNSEISNRDKNSGALLWFGSKEANERREKILQLIDNCEYMGLDKNDYQYQTLKQYEYTVNANPDIDRTCADAITAYLKDVLQGKESYRAVSYDEVSKNISAEDERKIGELLKQFTSTNRITFPEPVTAEYKLIKTELQKQLDSNNKSKIAQLNKAINIYRWIHHNNYNKYIIVNAASAILKYYENGAQTLDMKVVVGKPATKTPRFAAYCNEVILYPYWNVPRSIAVNEILPACKRNPGAVTAMNLQVLNASGQVVSPYSINWKELNKNNFHYRFRQLTGCDNALGVIKFNLTSPYSVYLHDTNLKSAFKSKKRYLSHGCIRVEKPVELANHLLPEQIDEQLLEACVKNQTPITKKLNEQVPVFVIYSTVDVINDTVTYLPDTYNLD